MTVRPEPFAPSSSHGPSGAAGLTVARLVAIGGIFLVTALAWALLGANVVSRTGERDSVLRHEVEGLWGTPQEQPALQVSAVTTVTEDKEKVTRDDSGQRVTTTERVSREVLTPMTLLSTRADVDLRLAHRQKGLLWFPTYTVHLAGTHTFKNESATAQTFEFAFGFPSAEAIYDDFRFELDGEKISGSVDLGRGMTTRRTLAPGQTVTIAVNYHSRGIERWGYRFGHGVSDVRDFSLDLKTDFDGVDFPAGTISPNEKIPQANGTTYRWAFRSLVSGQQIGVTMPQKLNPGPLVSRIAFFAPVSLLFFFVVMVILGVVRRRNLHPMNYFFLAGAFFAFHLLLAYLVDHMNVHAAFALSAATSVFLVVSYLRLVAGNAVAFLQAGTAQFVFLVLFSYTFFFEGKSGLAAAVGAVVTLFVLMQVTARVNWNDIFNTQPAAGPSANGTPIRISSGGV